LLRKVNSFLAFKIFVKIFGEKHTQNIPKMLKSWGSGRGAYACLDTSGVSYAAASDKHTPHACF